MKIFQKIFWGIGSGVCLLILAQQHGFAEQTHLEDSLWIREGGANYYVTFPGTWIEYDDGESCGNSAHKTTKGQQRYFNHAHVNYSLPRTGTDVGGVTRVVTVLKIKAYWDNEYNMSSSGGEDVKYNCWGYALGYSTWIQDPAYIYSDDYTSITVAETNCISALSGHVIKITEVTTPAESTNKVITKTSEKNQPSGIYNKTYSLPSGASLSNLYKKK